MNFKTYRFSFLLLTFLAFAQLQAQVKNCKITYEIDFSGAEIDDMAKSMMEGSTMNLSFMDQKSRVEMNMNTMSTTLVSDQGAKKGVILLDMMGMKIASPMEEKDFEGNTDPMDNYEVNRTGETKKIAGYKCERILIKGEDDNSMEGWYCDEIRPDANTQYNFSKVQGFPLEMEVNSNGMKMKMTATKVELKGLDPADFSTETPAGYTVMSQEQLKQMGSGR